jgi:hypothetical protein
LAEYRMGPARITHGGVIKDWFTRGCKWNIDPTLKEIKWDQFGDTVYDKLVMGATVTGEMVVAVKKTDDMAIFLSWADLVTDGTKLLIDGMIHIGRSMRDGAKSLLLHPLDFLDSDVSNDLYIPIATCTSGFQKIYEGTNEDVFTSKWEGFIDAETLRLFQIGDRTALADTTPPTVSSTDPTAAETDVAKASGLTIDFVMNEAIRLETAVKANTLMFATGDQSVFSDYTVSYISSSKTIRLTTNAALAASTEYCVMLNTGVKDVAGNALAAPYALKFTTGE